MDNTHFSILTFAILFLNVNKINFIAVQTLVLKF